MTDVWRPSLRWAYDDCLDPSKRIQYKSLMQSLERKHLILLIRVKRLTRKTICFQTIRSTVNSDS
ncbi:hypothetical protein BWI93_16825 [Siphonobacter sp. BAB-5385]|uniref:IS1 family transposase n=1 Tax=Siphonobacter sp. BAB-5385 TaxID=1864822 RepID=UPI000B9E0CBE|nr:hypothetical protein BWI93_16825 [Siphonobacter sp. BAB-5385]